MTPLARRLLGLVLVLAVPSIACVGYYAIEDARDWSNVARWALPLAWPAALIGLAAVVATSLSPQRTRRQWWAAALCFIAPVLVLLVARWHAVAA